MLRGINVHCGSLPTLVLPAALGAIWLSAQAEPLQRPAEPAHEPPAAITPDAESPLPDSAAVLVAFAQMRQWIDAGELPKMDAPASRLSIPNGSAACVILRRTGRVIGSGVHSPAMNGAIIDEQDESLALRRAAGRALNQVIGARSAREHPTSQPAVDIDLAQIGPKLTIELEIAGPLTPLAGRSFKRMAERLEMGLDGIALRRGESIAMLFPSQMRATNTADRLDARFSGLAVELGLPAEDFSALEREFGVAAYSFRTVHAAQARPADPPFITFRGQDIVPLESVNGQSIAQFTDGLARHLTDSLWPERPKGIAGLDHPPQSHPAQSQPVQSQPVAQSNRLRLGIMGDYEPAADRYSPLFARPEDQALASLALSRYAACTPPIGNPDLRNTAAESALLILRDLQTVEAGEDDPLASLLACGLIVHAVLAQDRAVEDPAIRTLFDSAAAAVLVSYRPDAGFIDALNDPNAQPATSRRPSPHTQAILAGALVRLLAVRHNGVTAANVRGAIDAAWASAPEQQHVALLPWIGWAETGFADATGKPLANAAKLIALRQVVNQTRVGVDAEHARRPNDVAPDLTGGFVLASPAQPGGRRLHPTAQTARPAAFLASMLGDEKLTPANQRQAARADHFQTMRFLMQLAVSERELWQFGNPQHAAGGVCQAVWDSEQPVAAQAMALLAAAETMRNMARP